MTGNSLRLARKSTGISQINGLDDLCQGRPSKAKAKDFASGSVLLMPKPFDVERPNFACNTWRGVSLRGQPCHCIDIYASRGLSAIAKR